VKVYVGAVGGQMQYMEGVLSLQKMAMRPLDYVSYLYNTSGALARGEHAVNFINGDYDAILQIDLDMDHPPNLLEQLRTSMEENDLDMVTAHYFRRQIPPYSVCSLPSADGEWPYPPLWDVPDKGVIELANTGMGCVLIKREVVQAVWDTLPKGDNPFYPRAMPEKSGDHRRWGSDFAFFTMARDLGYRLWLDASVESKHGAVVWIDKALYNRYKDTTAAMQEQFAAELFELRRGKNSMEKAAFEARKTNLENQRNKQQALVNKRKMTVEMAKAQLEKDLLALHAIESRLEEVTFLADYDQDPGKYDAQVEESEIVDVEAKEVSNGE